MLTIGTRVRFKQDHPMRGLYNEPSQTNQQGTVIEQYPINLGPDEWVKVCWDDGDDSRNYKCDALEVIHAGRNHIPMTSGVGPNVQTREQFEKLEEDMGLYIKNPNNDWIFAPNPCAEVPLFNNHQTGAFTHENLKDAIEKFRKEELPMESFDDFNVGDKVSPNRNHKDYNQFKYQHKGDNGTVTEIETEGWVRVRWSNGHNNIYRKGMLNIIEKGEDIIKSPIPFTQDDRYAMPILIGMRVCLDPESSIFKDLNETAKGTAGYVYQLGTSNLNLTRWKTLKSKGDAIVYVRFDNGNSLRLKERQILLVDSPSVTVTGYMFNNGDEESIIEGINEGILDFKIINRKLRIVNREIYDDAYRKRIMDSIANS